MKHFPAQNSEITAAEIGEISAARARFLLAKLKSYEEWLRTASEEAEIFSDPKAFYDEFAAVLRALCADGNVN